MSTVYVPCKHASWALCSSVSSVFTDRAILVKNPKSSRPCINVSILCILFYPLFLMVRFIKASREYCVYWPVLMLTIILLITPHPLHSPHPSPFPAPSPFTQLITQPLVWKLGKSLYTEMERWRRGRWRWCRERDWQRDEGIGRLGSRDGRVNYTTQPS